jgi:hypothetical protein
LGLKDFIMRKVYLAFSVIALSFLLNTTLKAQEIGAGVRFSTIGGFTGKFLLDQNQAIEAQLNSNGSGIDIVGLYEYHMNIPDAPQWRWFFGAGAHIGTWSHEGVNATLIGIDGIIGIEYLIKTVPIGISLDFKPAFDFSNYADNFIAHNTIGIAGRYYFNRHTTAKKPAEK